eukprot:m.4121 g.4121  ORF g.4121 m.4121 type:complete len:162 (-) comp1134_c0_seq1:320-805(-)
MAQLCLFEHEAVAALWCGEDSPHVVLHTLHTSASPSTIGSKPPHRRDHRRRHYRPALQWPARPDTEPSHDADAHSDNDGRWEDVHLGSPCHSLNSVNSSTSSSASTSPNTPSVEAHSTLRSMWTTRSPTSADDRAARRNRMASMWRAHATTVRSQSSEQSG